jgi:hypothetical protein
MRKFQTLPFYNIDKFFGHWFFYHYEGSCKELKSNFRKDDLINEPAQSPEGVL